MDSIILLILGLGAIFLVYWSLKPKAKADLSVKQSTMISSEQMTATQLPLGQKRIVSEEVHQIPRHALDDNAMSVVYRLLDAGYEAYLVGGCVRDLLAGTQPKDFDVATSAHPEQAEPLFKRARLIGRRFKLLHVRFGREVIEVATFRASHDSEQNTGEHGRQAESGIILRDNVYGSIEDDALRRDFSINALYYSVEDHSVLDFSNGYPDLLAKKIRIIGDPEERYREDPVRMLRAARFAAKLGFEIEEGTAAPIRKLAPMLARIAPARMFDETLKLLQTGYGEATLRQLLRFDLFQYLLPATDKLLGDGTLPVDKLVQNSLRNTDRRLSQGKSVTPAFLFAAMLWYPLTERIEKLKREDKRMPALQRLHEAANQILAEQQKTTAVPRRFSSTIREIWELQHRLERTDRADQIIEHPRFRAGYDLLLLREENGEELDGLSQWWTEFQNGIKPVRTRRDDSGAPKKRRRPRNTSQKRSNNRRSGE